MLYKLHDLQYVMFSPARYAAEITKNIFTNPFNPLSYTNVGRTVSAGSEMFERLTRRFGKPGFDLPFTTIGGKQVAIKEEIIVEKPFGSLLHFKRDTKRKDPKVLIVAPMSGHYATLLRGTVEALLPHHEVYITDWVDAKMVPMKEGRFNLDDSINYIRQFLSLLGPIDTRISKTSVTETAEKRPLSWFKKTVIDDVPAYYPGAHRKVYPGFLQLSGFMSMNLDRHVGSHLNFFKHVVQGDGDSAEAHRKFYDEYNAVMDLDADFYLQTVDVVFQRQLLPKGLMKWRDPLTEQLHDVLPKNITHTAILTVEGELDDISARGQTTAAHDLSFNLSQAKQFHHFQLGCGHYGIFNGRKWRNDIMPRARNFMRMFDKDCDPIPPEDLKEIPDIAPERYNRDKHGVAAVRRWLREQEAKAKAEGTKSKFFEGSES